VIAFDTPRCGEVRVGNYLPLLLFLSFFPEHMLNFWTLFSTIFSYTSIPSDMYFIDCNTCTCAIRVVAKNKEKEEALQV
jgi:hypothetical protein